ncbi:dopamine receptor 1-like isoform X1 [Mya arenaria]|uniref:dopamine receptor 1-like isoform X1 n=1 Tax=Mya arenaria TaxID=6604 RepID=UPI0022DEBA2B|nr:dopamine receptor 1-like isoform X1 [Mya arenaria]XP_052771865.1 dopamine receptor 1-like isoform X1 [Mya arenaria]XP_052771866.1 dopamine receptor 1-like isoform X1 [Mya arenaria]XP_052771867.1 dopamine receptor 1-like isoform X1 [Mya arenaria]XP_052771868.1 dopamine receptor 1-like isoform X1 [Mya arenaria]XP_052771869.1 dopamine receptor 1-like isoform X1 [Mya arenaria]XP_052771871.1 dopamine receptor 1-like isoform X1 [Mya arenaria]XP_052771872.1 dopamine receptor 1-like isoform X1 [M
MIDRERRERKMLTNYTVVGATGNVAVTSVLVSVSTMISTTTSLTPFNESDGKNVTDDSGTSETSNAYKAVIGTFLCLTIFLSLAGNTLVCIAVFTDRRLKRLNNMFIVSLAVADLWVSLMVMTFATVNDITGKWMLGPIYCKIWISSDIMGSTASILNLCVISLDRYIHIRDPLKYTRLMNWKKVVIAITLVWTISIILSFIPIHMDWHRTANMKDSIMPPEQCYLEISGTYAVVSSTISFYIPCIVMLALYCKLYMYAREQVRCINSTLVHNQIGDSRNSGQASRLSDHKAAVTLGVIMGVFLFCWLPFFILNLYEAYAKNTPIIVFQILTWLGYFNSCLNPIIYSIFNSEFRNAFKRILFPRTCPCLDRDSRDYRWRGSPKKTKNGTSTHTDYLSTRQENGSKASQDSKHLLVDTEKITAL